MKSPWKILAIVASTQIFKIWAIRAIARYALKRSNKYPFA